MVYQLQETNDYLDNILPQNLLFSPHPKEREREGKRDRLCQVILIVFTAKFSVFDIFFV